MTALFTLLPEAVATIRADGKPAIMRALAQRFAAAYGLDEGAVLPVSKSARSWVAPALAAVLPSRMSASPGSIGQSRHS